MGRVIVYLKGPELLLAASSLPGYRRAWTISVFSTMGNVTPRELHVHLVAFASDALLDYQDAFSAGLCWPETIERSVPRRRAEFIFGRLAARLALTGVSPSLAMATVAIGPHGEPLWPAGLIGSISHIAGLAGAVTGPADSFRFLGIDLTRPARNVTQEALRTLVLDEIELDRLRAASPQPNEAELEDRATQVFSAKECLFKAAFPMVDRFFEFSAARLCAYQASTSESGPICRLALEIHEEVGGPFMVGSRWWIEIWAVPGTAASLAVLAG